MKSLQTRYSLLQGTYWAASCSMVGFIAIFLVHLGLSNTEIGLASGLSCLLACLLAPVLSDLTSRWSGISLQRFLSAGMLASALLYLSLTVFSPSRLAVMLIFMLAYCLNTSMVPLLSSISMDYIARGKAVNFGLSRGIGSICYASSAVVFSHLSTSFSPAILAWIFLIGSLLFVWLLFQTPAAYGTPAAGADLPRKQEESSGFSALVRRSPKFIALLAGFGLLFTASTSLATYLVSIMTSLGGSESLYGLCIFAMAASELPVMSVVPRLIQRFGCTPLLFAAGGMYLMRNGLICLAGSVPVLILGLLLQGASFGLMTGVMTYYVREALSDRDQVLGQTCFIAATNGLGGAAGNLLGGLLQDTFGLSAMIGFCLAVSIAGALIVMKTCRPARFVLSRRALQS